MSHSLSDRQQAICGYIQAFLEAEQWPPAVRDIAAFLRVNSTGHVAHHLQALADGGYIERGQGARCIRLTDAGRQVAEAYLAKVPRREGVA